MTFIYSLIVFILGLVFGSFLNVLVHRLPRKESLFSRSQCPRCGTKISWFDNIPLLNFILLRGHCRHCQTKISWQYPLVELVAGLLFLFSFIKISSQFSNFNLSFLISLLRSWLIIFTGLFIFIYDLKYLEIEDRVVLPLSGLILISNFFLSESLPKVGLAIIIGVGFFLLQYIFTRGRAIGLGDLRIGFFMAVALSWPKIFLALIFSYLIGGLIAVLLLLLHKKKLRDQLPLGPFLVAGTFLTLFWGEQIINWYLNNLML
jgi:prepilin signal peptidase PulO-like enzyme (type II secretory pathway)